MKVYSITLLLASALALSACNEKSDLEIISSFDECVAAGYAIMESYPEQCATEDGTVFINEKQEISIRIVKPESNSTVGNRILVEGEAKGTWYFEATFPIRIENESGEILGNGYVEAESDWMTENFVPFKGVISLNTTFEGEAILILEKANPSDLPENKEEVKIPVIIKIEELIIDDENRIKAETAIRENIKTLTSLEPVLGGTFFVTDIEWQNGNKVLVTYEDGHIQGMARANITVDNNNDIVIENFEEISPSS